jgi:hypothetical protein
LGAPWQSGIASRSDVGRSGLFLWSLQQNRRPVDVNVSHDDNGRANDDNGRADDDNDYNDDHHCGFPQAGCVATRYPF